jgi:hypothetical protein
MDKKKLGIALLVAGVLLLLVGLLADPIGIGGSPEFGYKQIAAVVVGVIAAVAGYILSSRK